MDPYKILRALKYMTLRAQKGPWQFLLILTPGRHNEVIKYDRPKNVDFQQNLAQN